MVMQTEPATDTVPFTQMIVRVVFLQFITWMPAVYYMDADETTRAASFIRCHRGVKH